MKTTMITYAGAQLEVSSFLVENDLWPFGLPLAFWPTFCGAGDGWGDVVVPDHVFGVDLAPACFQHDIDYALSNRNWLSFMAANRRLHNNIKSLMAAHCSPYSFQPMLIANVFFTAVTEFGWPFFTPDATEYTWQQSQTIKDRLHRLAMHNLEYAGKDQGV